MDHLVFVVHLLLMLVQVIFGQNCRLRDQCEALRYKRHNTVGYPLNALTSEVGLLCPSAERSGIREIAWSVSTSPIDSQRQPIDVEADPKLHRVGYYLYMRNITGEYEGSYYCTVVFHDGSLSHTMSVGCLFVAGRASFKTCPNDDNSRVCNQTTLLKSNSGDDVEFDTRIEYRYGGTCRHNETIAIMSLVKLGENSVENVYICSSLGSFRTRPCANRRRVSVSYRGNHKYDIKLMMANLSLSDAGVYQVRVDVNDIAGGRRMHISKNFDLTVKEPPLPSTTIPPTTVNITTTPLTTVNITESKPEKKSCQGAVLLLNGQVLANDSNINGSAIMEGSQALLCVTTNKDCCGEGQSAQFLYPNGTTIQSESGPGLYITRGNQIVRLNKSGLAITVEEGQYCCSTPSKDGIGEVLCVNIEN